MASPTPVIIDGAIVELPIDPGRRAAHDGVCRCGACGGHFPDVAADYLDFE